MQDSFGEVKWLEIAQKGVEKYKGITEIAKLEGIANENISNRRNKIFWYTYG